MSSTAILTQERWINPESCMYSKEGDNSIQFEGKTVPWEHTIEISD